MEVLSGMQGQFSETMAGLHGSVSAAGLALLRFTFAVQFIYILYEALFRRSLVGMTESGLRLMITTAIFGGLIRGAPEVVTSVMGFFAGAAGSTPVAQMDPVAVLETGGVAAWQLIQGGGLLDKPFLAFLGLLIVLIFVAIALPLLLSLVESYFIGLGAAITFGLGGLSLTRDVAIAGGKMILGIAMKLFVMGIIARLIGEAVTDLVSSFTEGGNYSFGNAMWIIGAAALGAGVMWTIPRMAQMMLTGQGGMGLTQGLMGSAQFAVAALSGLAGAVADGVKSVIGAARLASASVDAARAASPSAGAARIAASSTGVAARAVAGTLRGRADGTGPRHGSVLWNAATNTQRANQAALEFAGKQREKASEAVQERRDRTAEQSRKAVASSARATAQEKRDEMQKARMTAKRGSVPPVSRGEDRNRGGPMGGGSPSGGGFRR